MTVRLRSVCTSLFATAFALACAGTPEPEESSAVPAAEPVASGAKPSAAASASPATANEPKDDDDGYDIIRAKTKSGETTNLAVKAPEGWKVVQPPSTPDPHKGKFGLAEAVKGLPGRAPLVATVATQLSALYCDLFDDKAPNTVANFIGLARGLRAYWSEKELAWIKRPHYDGTTFHRVIPGFMIQGGDVTGTGAGRLWFTIPDELHPSLKHDRAGQLCMANRGPNTNEGQFFVTDAPAPHLDGSYTIFGQCAPTEVVYRIARVPQSGAPNNRPTTPVVIEKVSIARVAGGAAALARKRGAGAVPSAELPRNTVPGVAPPGRAVQVNTPAQRP